MLTWEPGEISDDELLIRRFRNSDKLYKLNGTVARTIFQNRDGSYDKECSVYAHAKIRRDMEWCAGPIYFSMAAFGFMAGVPRAEGARVCHTPDPDNDAYSHTSMFQINDLGADAMVEDGDVLKHLPLCRKNVPDS